MLWQRTCRQSLTAHWAYIRLNQSIKMRNHWNGKSLREWWIWTKTFKHLHQKKQMGFSVQNQDETKVGALVQFTVTTFDRLMQWCNDFYTSTTSIQCDWSEKPSCSVQLPAFRRSRGTTHTHTGSVPPTTFRLVLVGSCFRDDTGRVRVLCPSCCFVIPRKLPLSLQVETNDWFDIQYIYCACKWK